jgi:hypothetical protein
MADGGIIPQMRSADDALAHSFASMVGQQVAQMMSKGIRESNAQTLADTDWSQVFSKSREGQEVKASPMSMGGKVKGKALVDGNSAANDIVPAMLSPGEIVIPRTIAKKSPDEIAQFIMALRGGM